MIRPGIDSALSSIPEHPLRGSFFRAIPLRHVRTPLSAIGSRRGGRYNDLQWVVDLGSPEALEALGIGERDLMREWRAEMLDDTIPITHTVGAAAKRIGIEALRYPSTRMPGASNLAVLVDQLRVGSRVTINPKDGFDDSTPIDIEGRIP